MKKTVIILSAFALIASSCGQATKKQVKLQTEAAEISAENIYTSSEQKYLIKDNGIDIFLIGQNIPTQTEGYSITKSIQTRTEEGEDFEIPVYTVFEDGQAILNIEPFGDEIGSKPDRIGNIFILSAKFKTSKNIGLHSTIEEFIDAYPNFTIWYSYVSDRYVIEAGEPFDGIQFVLDGNDFIDKNGPTFDSDMTILKPSEFKKGSKIKEIRIWGY